MTTNILSWIFGLVVLAIGIANTVLVHPVPGIVFLVLSMIYIPPIREILKMRMGFSIPRAVLIVLGFVIVWFTLGISDLGDMII